ncbi:MAG: preprotein translocase subunit SecG [Spirochaetaceae bacterium]|nr:preprotein translocase subunit SecG [Spirochaetaceae bacterium]MDE0445342.1 preprotein translocase subunit SecG [Spirochaetaceae bacterium]
MAIVSILILVVFVVSALLLMAVVLIQDDQGGGIGAMFGGGAGTPFGARTGNVMTRLTSILAVIFLAAAFTLAWMNRTPDAGNVIGRARAERMSSMERTDWWVAAPAPELLTEEAPAAVDASPAAAEGASPEAPAEAAAPAAAEGEPAKEAAAAEGGG